MSVTVVRYRTKADRADENQALIEKVFAGLEADGPDGVRYASFRLADGVSFVHVASIETGDGTNPLTSSAAFSDFVRAIGDRVEEAPLSSDATVVGSYRFWPPEAGNRP
jgi:hypothetical protein